MKPDPYPTVTGVILAGGLARRMGGDDKGLVSFQGRPLIQHVIDRLQLQVETLFINANRNIDRYQTFGYPIICDNNQQFQGPLAGMLSGMQHATTEYILTVPCDGPLLTVKLRQRMLETLLHSGKTLAVASDGQRLQTVYALIPVSLQADLTEFLHSGKRKVEEFFAGYPLAAVDFSDVASCFVNMNAPDDLQDLPITCQKPLLGIAAFSGTGKTTMLTQLIPLLADRGIKVAVIKHAHHKFDIDKPGKDSYQIREAGARQVLVASHKLLALMQQFPADQAEPLLTDCLNRLDYSDIDLVLVEGFKHAAFNKLELHRPELGHPIMANQDKNIIAIASDAPVQIPSALPVLDLNNIRKIAEFIETYIGKDHGNNE